MNRLLLHRLISFIFIQTTVERAETIDSVTLIDKSYGDNSVTSSEKTMRSGFISNASEHSIAAKSVSSELF